MSNPEKRDDRSMSDILASIRQIMAREPEATLPTPTRGGLNGVSGLAIDMPREPELKLPPRDLAPDGAAPSDAVSLDELLAETPRAMPLSTPVPAPPAGFAAHLEARSQPASEEPAKGASTKEDDTAGMAAAKDSDEVVPPAAMVQSATKPAADPANEAKAPTMDAVPSGTTVTPPMPKLGDLGSVVPGLRGGSGPPPLMETEAMRQSDGERQAFGAPITAPLPGDPMRTPAARGASPEVPGADALRRLIAGVIPPSAHPSVAPTLKAPEAAQSTPEPVPKPPAEPTRFIPRAPEADKSDTASKPTVEVAPGAKTEAKAEPKVPSPELPVAKKPDAPDPAPAPAPPILTTPAAVPSAKPVFPSSVPTRAAKLEPLLTAPSAPAPSAAPTIQQSGQPSNKSMDETVVELLRPLLRDWLNANMPRLIEPALKAELEALRSAAAKDGKD